MVQALVHLQRIGSDAEAAWFYQQLGRTLEDPDELTLLAELAEDGGRHPLVVQIGKAAQQRGIPVGTLAFPTDALPAYAGSVPKPALYAVARQESEFRQSAVSTAGAVGMFQVMPRFAGGMAKRAGIAYSATRLRADAEYNMQIGASELAHLLREFDGSYVLAFVGYNAGKARAQQWIKRFGDPRDPEVDVVDWIERIPFSETRNYVQRAMENLGVYRALFGEREIRIEADLKGPASRAKIVTLATPAPAPAPSADGDPYGVKPGSTPPKPKTVTASDSAAAAADAELAAGTAAEAHLVRAADRAADNGE
jgi:soluble lytic murein transglycosylase